MSISSNGSRTACRDMFARTPPLKKCILVASVLQSDDASSVDDALGKCSGERGEMTKQS